MCGIGVTLAGRIAGEVFELVRIELREGDYVTLRLPVRMIREDALEEQVVTLELFGQRVSGKLRAADIVKHEKGSNWPV